MLLALGGFLLVGGGLTVGCMAVGDGSGRTAGAGAASPGTSGDAMATQAPAPSTILPEGWTRSGGTRRPEQPLRGYGPLAGEQAVFTPGPGRQASYLRLTAADAAKARLTLAKYRADLRSLGGVADATITVGGRELPVAVAEGQGRILAVTAGNAVVILAAGEAADLQTLAAAVVAPLGAAASAAADAPVPAWLDTWDQHGFRFYYRPWETPKGTAWKDYDVLQEFDFAKRQDAGLVMWATPSEIDSAAGGTNRNWWGFARDAQVRRGQPWVLNTNNSIPTWLLNRHPGDIQQTMPQFSGGSHRVAESWCASSRALSWSSLAGKDEQLANLQQQVRTWRGDPLLLDYLEPHGELCHGKHDVFLEHGALADRSYRDWLKGRHGSLDALAKRWEQPLAGWDAVRVPEVADFLGWGPEAIDLRGDWRISYEPKPAADAPKPKPYERKPVLAPAEWFAAECDDRAWPAISAPGNDLAMHLPHQPAVLRRSFEVPQSWLGAGRRTWLYLWDLNAGEPKADVVQAHLNGATVGDDATEHATPHWGAYEVTSAIVPGRNTLALRLPQGLLGYRVYLSHHQPVHYPALGAGANARWVDFTDWRTATRVDAVRRGMAMIRGADAERSIINMAPDSYYAQIKQLCEEYGGRFHNTGHMGGFWNDYLPMLMRGSDLPFSLEPGGPAPDLPGFKHMMGLYFTEGVQAVHYFIHIGDVFWNDAIRQHFERIQPLVKTIGKVHPPKAAVAMLFSDRVGQFGGFPWGGDHDRSLPSGYWGCRVSDQLGARRHIDAITDRDFAADGGGNAAGYRVVIDSNSTVMDEEQVARIEGWVRAGGTFVTLGQSGRHTPERPDSWPIARLTGYRVAAIDPHDQAGNPTRLRRIRSCDETVFRSADWPADRQVHANGLTLEPVAPECRDLIKWEDGSVAAGVRPLGKGKVVHLGLKFGGVRDLGGAAMAKLLGDVLAWTQVAELPASAEGVMLRQAVSNNGLWDVWTLWNQDRQKPASTALRFAAPLRPAAARDLLTGRDLAVADGTLGNLAVEPLETRIFLTARSRIAEAPLAWLDLQRAWWRAARVPDQQLPTVNYDDVMCDLNPGWAVRTLDEQGKDDPAPLAAPALDDSAWPRRRLAPWAVPEELPSRRVLWRRTFTVPAAWGPGRTTLWLKSWFSWTMAGRARYWLDGTEVTQGDGRGGLILDLDPAAGARHVLAVEVRGEGTVCGPRGDAWLAFVPAAKERLDLAGAWTASEDLLRPVKPVQLPGTVGKARLLTRTVAIPAAWAGRQLWIHIDHSGGFDGVLVNGRYFRRHHHSLGTATDLNLSAWLRPGEDNRLELLAPGGGTVSAVELRAR